jgi:hypothetical protein
VNVESSIELTHPSLLVLVVTKWVCPMTESAALKNNTLKRISGPLTLYISYHWIFKVSPPLALPARRTSEYHSP